MSGQRSRTGQGPSGVGATFGWSVRLTVASIWLIVRVSFRASPRLATLVLLVAVVEATVPAGLAWTVQQLVDGLTGQASGTVRFAVVAMGVADEHVMLIPRNVRHQGPLRIFNAPLARSTIDAIDSNRRPHRIPYARTRRL